MRARASLVFVMAKGGVIWESGNSLRFTSIHNQGSIPSPVPKEEVSEEETVIVTFTQEEKEAVPTFSSADVADAISVLPGVLLDDRTVAAVVAKIALAVTAQR